MDSSTLSNVIRKHLKDIIGDTLNIRDSTSLTTHEARFITDDASCSKLRYDATFDVYSANEILCRCIVAKGVLYLSKKRVGRKSAMYRVTKKGSVEKFTLADPKSIDHAISALVKHLETSLTELLKKVEPIQEALQRIKEHRYD